jgi:hypothetical protein
MAERIDYTNIFKSPTLFAMKVLKVMPLRHQAQILEDESSRILIVSGRQAGKSTLLAIKALWTAFVKPSQDILIVAPTLRQSRVVYQRITDFILSSKEVKAHILKSNMEETRFDNGSYIRCLTASKTGETIRGFSATMLIFDEAGSIENDEVFSAVEPSLAVKGEQLILSGTPRGKRGYFYNNYATNDKTKRWQIYKFTSRVNPIITEDYLKEERANMTENRYLEEYEAEFIDEIGLFYPQELVAQCSEDYTYTLEREEGYKYYLGADISRAGSDETSIVIIAVPDDPIRKIRVVWAEGLKYSDITVSSREIIRKALAIGVEQVLVDAIGIGGGVYDIIQKELGSSKVTAVTLEGERRETAYTNLKIMLEKRRLILNENDTKMYHQFSSYSLKEKVGGGIRIVKSEEIHDDIVDGLVLALYGVESITKFTVFEGVNLDNDFFKNWAEQSAMQSVIKSPLNSPFYYPLDYLEK